MRPQVLRIAAVLLGVTMAGFSAHAADGDFLWARAMGGTNVDQGIDVALDSAGNVYTTGFFLGTVDFDPGAGTFNLTSAGSGDLFVSKLDASGNLVWARSMGGAASSDEGYGIAVDGAGNVYTTGNFSGTGDFDPGAGTANLTNAGSFDVFVQKLDASGNFVWARSLGGTSNDAGFGVVTDSMGNVLTTGYFSGTVDFDPGTGTVDLTSAGITDVFVQKLDPSGNLVWARAMGGTGDDRGLGIAVDSADNVYTTGYFRSTADFDPGAGTVSLTSAGTSDSFVQKLDSSGNLVWARAMGGTGDDRGQGITVDNALSVYTTGMFTGTADFDPGAGTVNLNGAGSFDVFAQKLDASGDLVWARSIGGANADIGQSIAVDTGGNVYTTGAFPGTVDFDPGVGTVNLTSAGTTDVFIQKLDASGNLLWAQRIGGTGDDRGQGIVLDSGGNALITGSFTGTADFDPGTDTVNLTSAGNIDIFVSKLSGSDVTPPTVSIGAPSATLVNPLSTVSFPITVSGADTINLTAGDVSIAYAGSTSGGTVNVLNGNTANPTVEVSGVGATSAGHYTITIAAGVASDLSANLSLAAGPSALVFVDGTGPIVTIGDPTGAPISSTTGELVFPVQILGGNTFNLTPANVTVNYIGSTSGGVLSVLNGNTAFATVLISQVSGDGQVTISIPAGVASDTAGNQSAAAGPSDFARVDNSAPSYSNFSADPASASAGQEVTLEFFTTEFTTTDPEVTVNGNPATRVAKGAPIYFYSYTVLPTDPAGPASIVVNGIDDAANVGMFSNNTALTILPSEQPLPLAAWPLGMALGMAATLMLRRRK